MRTRSMKGEEVDFAYHMAQNEEMIALGNASLNARGDVLDKRGNVVKKKEDIAAEYYARNPKGVKQVSLKNLDAEVLTPAEAVAQFKAQQTAKAAPAPKSRKISDSDQ